jgi:hypothetical protein
LAWCSPSILTPSTSMLMPVLSTPFFPQYVRQVQLQTFLQHRSRVHPVKIKWTNQVLNGPHLPLLEIVRDQITLTIRKFRTYLEHFRVHGACECDPHWYILTILVRIIQYLHIRIVWKLRTPSWKAFLGRILLGSRLGATLIN